MICRQSPARSWTFSASLTSPCPKLLKGGDEPARARSLILHRLRGIDESWRTEERAVGGEGERTERTERREERQRRERSRGSNLRRKVNSHQGRWELQCLATVRLCEPRGRKGRRKSVHWVHVKSQSCGVTIPGRGCWGRAGETPTTESKQGASSRPGAQESAKRAAAGSAPGRGPASEPKTNSRDPRDPSTQNGPEQ